MRVPLDHDVRVVGEPDRAVRGRLAAVVLEHRVVPLGIRLRPGLGEAVVDADRLQRRPFGELPAQVLAGDELPEPGVERADVVVLEIDLDEGLPVVVALVQLDLVQHEAREVEVAGRQFGQVSRHVARAIEHHAVPVADRRASEVQARLVGEVRRAEELALQVIGPAVDRADDVLRVALARQHQRLTVPADVRQQLDAVRVPHQRLRVVPRSEHAIVAGLGDHELVADVARRAREQQASLELEDAGIAVPGRGELRDGGAKMRGRGQIRHDLWSFRELPPTQPNNPGRLGRPRARRIAGSRRPEPCAKSATEGRIAKTC
ncbi:hypothetical protein LDC_2703 [sediment metagenome]|uniref:Uncharacterized protein n=1 Tax=sediment metagenome TaxID=749907 RepID=D9PMC5_9ZZZZ